MNASDLRPLLLIVTISFQVADAAQHTFGDGDG
jgi:hypothetical protein